VILSTGMADLPEIDEALETLQAAGTKEICLLHCVSWYPSPPEIINLRAMHTLRDRYGLPVGYSDHSLGTTLPAVAVGMGARCIEKHYTLDPKAFGPDHAASLSPAELIEMVQRIREVEVAMGTGGLAPSDIGDVELNQRRVHRRSVVTTKAIQKGDVFSEANLGIKRPGTGILPREFDRLLGQTAARDIQAEALLEEEDVS
jgi:N,N'-diacetyllegionaminate synthase